MFNFFKKSLSTKTGVSSSSKKKEDERGFGKEKSFDYLVVGLGNPGEKYQKTRHNVGFMVLDSLLDDASWFRSGKAQALYAKGMVGDREVEFMKPQTFMNNSGVFVSYAVKKHNLKAEQVIVIHDDLDLPLGEFKVSFGKGTGGHNGISSIIEKIGSPDFGRIRIGISPLDEEGNLRRPKEGSHKSYVLKEFTPGEKKKIDKAIEGALNALAVYVKEGREKAMNSFN